MSYNFLPFIQDPRYLIPSTLLNPVPSIHQRSPLPSGGPLVVSLSRPKNDPNARQEHRS
jgi:hypothetical protein